MSSRRSLFRRAATGPASAVACVALALAVLLGQAGFLAPADRAQADLWHRLAGLRGPARHVAIVTVGDADLLRFRNEPLVFWGDHFAQAVAALRTAGAAAVGLDVLFTVNAGAWLGTLGITGRDVGRTFDMAMRGQLARGKVVLAGSAVRRTDAAGEGGEDVLLPTADYLYALPGGRLDVGLTNLHPDPDDVVRGFLPALWSASGEPLGMTFPMLLALRTRGGDADADAAQGLWPLGPDTVRTEDFPLPIGYVGPPGSVPRVGFGRLLAPGAAEDPAVRRLAGRVVIVAVEPSGGQDVHLTPYSGGLFADKGGMMKGAEIQANIVETILGGRRPASAGPVARAALVLACVAAMAVLGAGAGQAAMGLAALALCAAAAASSYAAFAAADVLLGPAQAQAGVLAAYLGSICARLVGSERKRAWLRQSFGRYVSPEVVDELVARGGIPNLGGEARTVTVLFSDIRNFTTISEQLAPGEVMDMLNAYFDRACERIMARGGTVDKFIGDAVMAVFGSPCPCDDHPRRALAAALDISGEARAFREVMAERFGGRDLPEFNVGVGLHTGLAVVGNVGSHARMEFTALGDTVNLASRLEGASKQYGSGIVASRATVEAAGPGVATGARATISVKGRAEQVEIFEILGLESVAEGMDEAPNEREA